MAELEVPNLNRSHLRRALQNFYEPMRLVDSDLTREFFRQLIPQQARDHTPMAPTGDS